MNILIKNMNDAIELVEKHSDTYRVVSILSNIDVVRSIISKPHFTGAKEVFYLQFDNMDNKHLALNIPEDQFKLITKEDCIQVLDFLVLKEDDCIIHCYDSGRIYSLAMALGYFLKTNSDCQQAVEKLFEIRPLADPYPQIVKYMCEILEQEQKYEDILASIKALRSKEMEKVEKSNKKVSRYFG